ncbi:glycosyltransferase involved in cell wall biosynthesis [Algoriphagus iocasae]|uniref:Glycosyltransferase involved in cell wall biosynthesis n=1 Tax=Algoriphagus iocasae TaxID=1836499 RepID=A0A841MYW4_9BACT|nr:glycosyltransferase family 4 protein [Algoriphagus iocasae]MBB6327828.1 glycosyltransferase involved in cell wall biosynthesis [Algoriphagus iocasae]
MKIIQLVTSRKFRGAEISAKLLSEKLLSYGHQIWFVGLYSNDNLDVLSVKDGVNIDLINRKKGGLDFNLFFQLRKLFDSIQPDIIQANGSDTFKYAVLGLLGNKKPKLVYRNISIMSHWVKDRLLIKSFYKLLAKRVDCFVSVGELASSDLQVLLKLPSNKLIVIKRGIIAESVDKTKARSVLEEKYSIHSNDFLLIQVGSLSKEKNIEFSLELIHKLNARNIDVKLLIVGEGPEKERLQIKARELKIDQRVMFTGNVKNPQNYLAGADLLMMTSEIEGVPGAVIEAAFHKIPAIGVNVGGVKEVIIHEETGFLIDTHSINLFEEYIDKLVYCKSKLIALGENARKFAKKNHDIDTNSRKFESLYFKLLD